MSGEVTGTRESSVSICNDSLIASNLNHSTHSITWQEDTCPPNKQRFTGTDSASSSSCQRHNNPRRIHVWSQEEATVHLRVRSQ